MAIGRLGISLTTTDETLTDRRNIYKRIAGGKHDWHGQRD